MVIIIPQHIPYSNIYIPITYSNDNPSICVITNLSNRSFVAETATLDEIDLAFAISSAAAGAEATFKRIKDTVKEVMQTYKTDKLRYALLVFGRQPSSPIRFGLSLLDDETVGQFVEFVCLFFSFIEFTKYQCNGKGSRMKPITLFIGLPYRYLRLSKIKNAVIGKQNDHNSG